MTVYEQVNSPCLNLKIFDYFEVKNDECEKKLKLLGKTAWPPGEAVVRLYKIDGYYIGTVEDECESEHVRVIADNLDDTIEAMKEEMIKSTRLYYDPDIAAYERIGDDERAKELEITRDEIIREIEENMKKLYRKAKAAESSRRSD